MAEWFIGEWTLKIKTGGVLTPIGGFCIRESGSGYIMTYAADNPNDPCRVTGVPVTRFKIYTNTLTRLTTFAFVLEVMGERLFFVVDLVREGGSNRGDFEGQYFKVGTLGPSLIALVDDDGSASGGRPT